MFAVAALFFILGGLTVAAIRTHWLEGRTTVEAAFAHDADAAFDSLPPELRSPNVRSLPAQRQPGVGS